MRSSSSRRPHGVYNSSSVSRRPRVKNWPGDHEVRRRINRNNIIMLSLPLVLDIILSSRIFSDDRNNRVLPLSLFTLAAIFVCVSLSFSFLRDITLDDEIGDWWIHPRRSLYLYATSYRLHNPFHTSYARVFPGQDRVRTLLSISRLWVWCSTAVYLFCCYYRIYLRTGCDIIYDYSVYRVIGRLLYLYTFLQLRHCRRPAAAA